jgi:hypothetical protein
MASFVTHLFISYAHIDNQPLTPGQQGWISRFHGVLENLLSTRLGANAQIWRDEKLQGTDVFPEEIVAQFAKTALMISVLTPRYLKSEWCTREVAEFCKSAEQSGGLVVDNKSRVVKVLKTPVDAHESLPSVMQDVLGYEFFTYEDDVPMELDPEYGDTFKQAFYRKVNKLASDLSQLLNKLESYSGESGSEEQAPAKAAVYLAECSYDCKDSREILEGDLHRHGYTVLPDRQLPRDEDTYVAAVQSLLEHCVLSIHLVGNTYGGVPDGPSQKSFVVLQNELAIQRCKSGTLSRVIWLPEETSSEQAQQQTFIEALHRDASVQLGADLITGGLEELKTSIYATLRKLEKPDPGDAAAQASNEEGGKRIYLICTEQDRNDKTTQPVRKYLREQGFDVDTPAFDGDATAVREANRQCMSDCDAVILFYGAGDEAWKRTLDSELKKMPGYRDAKHLLASYIYLAGPKTADKEDLIDMEEPNLIDGLDDFSPAAMAEFIQAMNAAGKSS